ADAGLHALAVVRVQQARPAGHRTDDLPGGVPEKRIHVVAAPRDVGEQVPVPDRVAGRPRHQPEPLLAALALADVGGDADHVSDVAGPVQHRRHVQVVPEHAAVLAPHAHHGTQFAALADGAADLADAGEVARIEI